MRAQRACSSGPTSALVMGDLFLLVAALPGLDLKRGGVLNWNSRTRSASGLKGLFSCRMTQRKQGERLSNHCRLFTTGCCMLCCGGHCVKDQATHRLLCWAALAAPGCLQLKVVRQRQRLGGARWLGHTRCQHLVQLLHGRGLLHGAGHGACSLHKHTQKQHTGAAVKHQRCFTMQYAAMQIFSRSSRHV